MISPQAIYYSLALRWGSYVVVFTAAFLYLWSLTAPDSTWVNADHDGNNYIMGAKYLVLTHPTGAPLFNLLNWVLIRLPMPGTEYFALAIWSAIFSAGTATLLWHLTRNFVAPLVFLASGLVVGQSTIVETYAMVSFLMVLSYYFHTRDRHSLKYAVIGIGLAVHHLPFLMVPAYIIWDNREAYGKGIWAPSRQSLKHAAWILIALPFYLYIPIFNREPFLWTTGTDIKAVATYFGSQGGLIGGLAIRPMDNLFGRFHDMGLILLVGFAASLPLLIWAFYDHIKTKKWLLPVLVVLPSVYYFTLLTPNAFIYMVPAFAFGAIMIGGLRRAAITKTLVALMSILLMIANTQFYDIGDTLDPNLSAAAFYDQLGSLPNDAVVYSGVNGWERAAVWLYNFDHPESERQSISTLVLSKREAVSFLTTAQEARDKGVLYRSVDIEPRIKRSFIIPWMNPTDEELIEAIRIDTDDPEYKELTNAQVQATATPAAP